MLVWVFSKPPEANTHTCDLTATISVLRQLRAKAAQDVQLQSHHMTIFHWTVFYLLHQEHFNCVLETLHQITSYHCCVCVISVLRCVCWGGFSACRVDSGLSFRDEIYMATDPNQQLAGSPAG